MNIPSKKRTRPACPFYQKLLLLLCAATGGLLDSGCAYRFSNLHMKPPPGTRTIAIEAIYDTGKIAVPHEIIWEQLQKQFAINGRLRLVSRSEADLFLTTHIVRAVSSPVQIESLRQTEPDDFLTNNAQGGQIPHPLSSYPDYNIASSYAKAEYLGLTVHIQIHNLSTRKLIFSKTYPLNTTWATYDASIPPEYLFLKSEETFETNFTDAAELLAKAVVVEFLSGSL